jgi:hypothetical protein
LHISSSPAESGGGSRMIWISAVSPDSGSRPIPHKLRERLPGLARNDSLVKLRPKLFEAGLIIDSYEVVSGRGKIMGVGH